MTLKSLHYGAPAERVRDEDAMEGFSPVPPPLPRRQPVRNIYAEPFAEPRLATPHSAGAGSPLVLPVFPLRGSPPSPGAGAAYSPSRFHTNKRCRHRCSWRGLCIASVCVCALLAATLAYFLAVSSGKSAADGANCILVQDVKAVTQAHGAAPLSSPSPPAPTDPPSPPPDEGGGGGGGEGVWSSSSTGTAAPEPAGALELDKPLAALVPPRAFWSCEFRSERPAHVTLNLTLPWGANLAVYGRRNVAPSVTQYDFAEVLRGGRRARREAEAEARAAVSLLQFLDTGRWFVAVYNDELRPQRVTLVLGEARAAACAGDCSGRGLCHLGRCECHDGFRGDDCSQSVCPVLCGGRGRYAGGSCRCDAGWKGPECDVPEHDCEPADCSGHGECEAGLCRCRPGWKGDKCDKEDCLEPTCGGHGACVDGRCVCRAGWRGAACSERDARVQRCLPACSQRGVYDLESGKCVCDPLYTGDDCSQAACSLECGPHGACAGSACVCADGWTGSRCDMRPCDARCSLHGQCRNGTCVCSHGWNGKHCTLPGCGVACSRHGQCVLQDREYRCACAEGWAGADCALPLETDCSDSVDNDRDGTTDCSDSECCARPECADHIMCLASNDPVEVLLRKQPPSVTASFYQRVKFLIEENSVQSYAHMDEYSERRVAVVRGQVVSAQGLGVVGVRVSVDRDARFGFTLTRHGGWFDVLVNGGGAVTLQFQRSPYKPLRHTVFVPWNQIVSLQPVRMQLADEAMQPPAHSAESGVEADWSPLPRWWEAGAGPCAAHQYETLRPRALAEGAPPAPAAAPRVLAEARVVTEAVRVPGAPARLTYRSAHAPGFLSVLRVQLTRAELPPGLSRVHVRVDIEGCLHTRTYEADPNITHLFAWNKRNVYKQKVYGLALAKISVGYEYAGCARAVWEPLAAWLRGFSVDISDVGGWGLHIHHHYNFHEGILQRGDGAELHLKQFPRAVKVVAGTGQQRALACDAQCEGAAADARLLAPGALAAGPDGSLYVGDFNLVRRIAPDGRVSTVLQLGTTRVAYQYYLCVSPADGALYLADPERHQVLRALALDSVRAPADNSEPVVGTGERCIPGDDSSCGDGGPARAAKLAHPKGLAIAADRTMYIADGTNIRAVEPSGVIRTLVGQQQHRQHWSGAPCAGAVPASAAQLQWPTALALSPLDGALHVADDRLVLRLAPDLTLRVAAGRPAHCRPAAGPPPLGSVLALAFAPTGELYIAEADARKTNTVKALSADGRVRVVAGRAAGECACAPGPGCACGDTSTETLLATNAVFKAISALAVTPDGVLNIADQGSLHILALEHYLPGPDESGEFRIPHPPDAELYVFNRYGQHTATRHLVSGKTIYTFLYSKNTSFGKLSTVTDAAGNKMQLLRDYSSVVNAIESSDNKLELNISAVGFLTRVARRGAEPLALEYDAGTGLLTSRESGGETVLYAYDAAGRVRRVTLPTGERVQLGDEDGGVAVRADTAVPLRARYSLRQAERGAVLALELRSGRGRELLRAAVLDNGTLSVAAAWGGELAAEARAPHPLLAAALPVLAELLRPRSHQRARLGDAAPNTLRLQYSLVGDARAPQQTLRTDLALNDSRALTVEFDQFRARETFLDAELLPLLAIEYDASGLPLSFVPHAASAPLNISYDRFNRIAGWTWGAAGERYAYDARGLLAEAGGLRVRYDEAQRVAELTLPSGRAFQYEYDAGGGLARITLPAGTHHDFGAQPSLGFVRVTYTPPGGARPYLQHLAGSGELLLTVFPGEGARVVRRYAAPGRLKSVAHGDGLTQVAYSDATGLPTEVRHVDRDVEYHCELTHARGLLVEERLDFGSESGLSDAKLQYEYDAAWRPTAVLGRIGGQTLIPHRAAYAPHTGAPALLGQFAVSRPAWNRTVLSDGTATFSRALDEHFRQAALTLTIHRAEVFRLELEYEAGGRVARARTHTRNVGVNTYTSGKNYTWDADGQLLGVEAQEPWGFRYDAHGNMLALAYRGNTIPLQYDSADRLVKFGEGQYRYDARGLVVQNAREERFAYSAAGLLARATKRGRFDVRYYYDHLQRLSARKDNFGNVTQFFYTNRARPHELTHVYSPRDNRFMTLVYDDRGHLIYTQVARHKYYIATDPCGTPVMVFNQYGEGVREIMRSPYGHIVYDSNPYLYLPVDFCGGLLDPATSLVHMPSGQVYDPLIGQWMSPQWEDVLSRAYAPARLSLYRFHGNDPINYRAHTSAPADHVAWLKLLGYDLESLAPQLFRAHLPGGRAPPAASADVGGAAPAIARPRPAQTVASAFLTGAAALLAPRARALSASPLPRAALAPLAPPRRLALADPPLGRGILLSRAADGRAVVSAAPGANAIYRDVYTSVLNDSQLLPLSLTVHGDLQDAFYFVRADAWRAPDDRQQLKRLQGKLNVTFHDAAADGEQALDVKIHTRAAVVNLRYGTTAARETARLLHHARAGAARRAWHRERELVLAGGGSRDWSAAELDEIHKTGSASGYAAEYARDVALYPELAEDPYNVRFVRKRAERSARRRRKPPPACAAWWLARDQRC